jgi:1-acyl-sn-glycerol-3-phosphate acyltransferase
MGNSGQMSPMRFVTKLLYQIMGALNFTFLYISLFFTANVLPVFAILFLRPLHVGMYEKLLCFIAELNFVSITDWSEFVGGLELVVTGDPLPTKSSIVMSNHVSFSDSILLHVLAGR